MLTEIRWDEWHRGGDGQGVYMLLHQDPDKKLKLERVAIGAMREGNEEAAWAALYLTVCLAKDSAKKYEAMLEIDPDFRTLERVGEMAMILHECGSLPLFE